MKANKAGVVETEDCQTRQIPQSSLITQRTLCQHRASQTNTIIKCNELTLCELELAPQAGQSGWAKLMSPFDKCFGLSKRVRLKCLGIWWLIRSVGHTLTIFLICVVVLTGPSSCLCPEFTRWFSSPLRWSMTWLTEQKPVKWACKTETTGWKLRQSSIKLDLWSRVDFWHHSPPPKKIGHVTYCHPSLVQHCITANVK